MGDIQLGNRFWPSGAVGPESEAESVRFHGRRRLTKVGPEVKHGLPEGWGRR